MTIGPSGKAWKDHVRTSVEDIDKACPGGSAGTYNGHDPSISLAADFMCNKAVGDKIAAYAKANALRLGIWYIIWYGRIWSRTRPEKGWQRYFDAGNPNPSRAHTNHVHLSFYTSAPKPPKTVTMWATGEVKGYEPSPSSKVKHVRQFGFKLVGTLGNRSDGQYLVTASKTWYPLDGLSEKDPNPVTPKPPAVDPPVVEPKPPVTDPSGVNVRIATWNTRRSSFTDDKGTPRDWEHRDELAKAFLLGIDGGTPGALLAQECTKEQTRDLSNMVGYKGIGNGLGGHPKDVAGDNVAVFVTADYTVKKVVTVKSTTENPRFVTWALLTRNHKTVWVGSTHLTAGAANRSLRGTEIAALLKASVLKGVDLKRAVFGGDINERSGDVRGICAGFGLRDLEEVLPEAQRINWKTASFTGWDPDQETGPNIDALFIGAGIAARDVEMVPVTNGASDHNLILARLTL
jgi:hypothetical protein